MEKQSLETGVTREDENRLEREIEDMEKTLYESYCDVGKAVLETAETEGRKINDLVDRIIEKKRRLVDMRGDRGCPGCGGQNSSGSRYCSHCGRKLDDHGEEPKS